MAKNIVIKKIWIIISIIKNLPYILNIEGPLSNCNSAYCKRKIAP